MLGSVRLVLVAALAASLAAVLMPIEAIAQAATAPTQDIPNARDNPLLRRYDGSFIVDYAQRAFEEFELPTAELKLVPGKKDAKNNDVFAPTAAEALEGRFTRIVYVAPANRSPLEVMRNYQEEVTGKGGTILFSCRDEACGGDNSRSTDGGGGHQSLLMRIYPPADVKASYKSNGYCAVTDYINGLRYAAMRLPTSGGNAHAAIAVYSLRGGTYCEALKERTIVVVTLIEPKAREQRMVTVGAQEMNAALGRDGRIVLYNILFDFDKADIKPDSKPQLEEIGRLLQGSPNLRLHVVGHTDNVGQLTYNMDLSRRRSQSVVQALVQANGIAAVRLTGHGVGPLAPVAPNTDDAGRARNRRTELVPQ
jgi:OmpA-OmpF porin, OOP family